MVFMSNELRKEMDKIEIPKGLSERSKTGITQAKLEMKKPKKKWTYVVGPILAASMAFGLMVPGMTNKAPENAIVKMIDTDTVIDVDNPREVVGFSDNVFLGKVIKKTGKKSLSGYPETQFEVQVYENIKGELKGDIKINQSGGYDGKYLFLMEEDELLVEGQTYLFATRYLKEEDWHTIVPSGGSIEYNTEKEKVNLIEKYKKAYEEEIPFKLN